MYNTCFADSIALPDIIGNQGVGKINETTQVVSGGINPIITIAIIAVLGIIVTACTVAIIIAVLSKPKKVESKTEVKVEVNKENTEEK